MKNKIMLFVTLFISVNLIAMEEEVPTVQVGQEIIIQEEFRTLLERKNFEQAKLMLDHSVINIDFVYPDLQKTLLADAVKTENEEVLIFLIYNGAKPQGDLFREEKYVKYIKKIINKIFLGLEQGDPKSSDKKGKLISCLVCLKDFEEQFS